MVQIEVGELVMAFIVAMGIPSAVMGLIVWRAKRPDRGQREGPGQEE